ncbi:hypothetical protein ACMV5I_02980 [Serratia sp. T13T92]|jgi:hypothetical protein|uniref:hypothetical protein n=1 Tax=Serratia sp. T13T92 TaxID=3397496 RepID=UPI0039E1726B
MKIRWPIWALLCGIIAIMIGYWKVGNKKPETILSCRSQAKLIFDEKPDSPIFNGTYALRLNSNGSGVIGITGMLTIGGQNHRVLHTVIVHYRTLDAEQGWFDVRRSDDAIEEGDNTPKSVIDTYLLGCISGKIPRVFRVSRWNDKAYMIGNMHSPIMVCSRTDD